MTAACAAPRHGENEAETEPSAALCKPCRLDLTGDLRRLPNLDRELATLALTLAAAGNGGLPLPFDDDVSEWRAWFRRNIFHGFTAATDDRGYCPVLDPSDPYPMCAWLRPQVSRSARHPAWIAYRDWAPSFASAIHMTRVRGEQLAAPLVVKHIFLPGACLACGNGRMRAVIYADHAAGRWSYWVCPACQAVTEIERWWDYPRRLREAG